MNLRMSAVCVLLVLAIGLGGCSLVFATDAPAPEIAAQQAETEGRIRCTRGRALPIVDTVVAAVMGLRGLVALLLPDSFYEFYPISREADAGIAFGMLGLFGASSAYGFDLVGDCRAAYELHLPDGPVPLGVRPGGCTSDVECKGERVCIDGRCTELR